MEEQAFEHVRGDDRWQAVTFNPSRRAEASTRGWGLRAGAAGLALVAAVALTVSHQADRTELLYWSNEADDGKSVLTGQQHGITQDVRTVCDPDDPGCTFRVSRDGYAFGHWHRFRPGGEPPHTAKVQVQSRHQLPSSYEDDVRDGPDSRIVRSDKEGTFRSTQITYQRGQKEFNLGPNPTRQVVVDGRYPSTWYYGKGKYLDTLNHKPTGPRVVEIYRDEPVPQEPAEEGVEEGDETPETPLEEPAVMEEGPEIVQKEEPEEAEEGPAENAPEVAPAVAPETAPGMGAGEAMMEPSEAANQGFPAPLPEDAVQTPPEEQPAMQQEYRSQQQTLLAPRGQSAHAKGEPKERDITKLSKISRDIDHAKDHYEKLTKRLQDVQSETAILEGELQKSKAGIAHMTVKEDSLVSRLEAQTKGVQRADASNRHAQRARKTLVKSS